MNQLKNKLLILNKIKNRVINNGGVPSKKLLKDIEDIESYFNTKTV